MAQKNYAIKKMDKDGALKKKRAEGGRKTKIRKKCV